MPDNPFAVLGLDVNATAKQVQSAFRRLALHCHPDRHPKDPLAKARFLRLSRAKEALLDPTSKHTAANAAEYHRRNQCESRPNRPSPHFAKRSQQTQKSAEAARRRQTAAEKLRKREVEAETKRQRAKKEAEMKRRCDELFAVKQREAQEKAAKQERQKADLFDAFLRKKQKVDPPSRLREIVHKFIRSSEQMLTVPGPLTVDQCAQLGLLAASHGLIITEGRLHFHLSHPNKGSGKDSACGPPERVHVEKKAKWSQKHVTGITESVNRSTDTAARHRKAVERLQIRRQNGEGLTTTPQGSWWIHDEEAERWERQSAGLVQSLRLVR